MFNYVLVSVKCVLVMDCMGVGGLQVWQLGSNTPNFTLEGHEKGVNCIDYYSGGDKPYLISGADDRLVKIWDYQVLSHAGVYTHTHTHTWSVS